MSQKLLAGSGGRRRALARGALAAAFAAGLATASPGLAVDYVVTKTADSADGVCDADCSLREAVIAANASVGFDRILLGAGTYGLSLSGGAEDLAATGDLDVNDPLEIRGQGAAQTVVDGNQLDTVLAVNPLFGGATLTLRDLAVTDGVGGIRNWGWLEVTRCLVTGNSTAYDGAGIDSELGATLNLIDSTVSDNIGGDGGGLGSQSAAMYVTGSTISGNVGYLGGGIFAQGLLVVTNSTISGNVLHVGGAGSALYSTQAAHFSHTTVADNVEGAGAFDFEFASGSVVFSNVVAVGTCHFGQDVTSQSLGGNLEATGDTCHFIAASDQVGVADPGLGGLADNGGRTWTYEPFPGSPAIDGGVGATVARDQRWFPRPFDGDGDGSAAPDAGAVEVVFGWIYGDDFELGSLFAWSASAP